MSNEQNLLIITKTDDIKYVDHYSVVCDYLLDKHVYHEHQLLNLMHNCAISRKTRVLQSYLPGTGESVINKANPPGRGPSIALRLG